MRLLISPGIVSKAAIRRLFIIATLASVANLQGCATNLETFGLGAGVGVMGTIAALSCAVTSC